MVQWDTSEHAWLEDRGPKLYLISMIDDATSRIHARFVRHDSTEENMRLLWSYLEGHGRPLSFYTDKASLFQTVPEDGSRPQGAATGRTGIHYRPHRLAGRFRNWISFGSPRTRHKPRDAWNAVSRRPRTGW